MSNINVQKCIEESEKLIFQEESEYQEIMNIPTLNHIELYNQMPGSWNSYLGVLGSFGPSLEAILRGSKNIVTFDINPLNILHAYLIIAAVISLEYEEFLKFIFYSREQSYYSKYYFDRLKVELSEEAKAYWQHIISSYELHPNFISLFYNQYVFYDDCIEEIKEPLFARNSYFKKEHFYLLKQKLKMIKIKFLWEDFKQIPNQLKGQKFDKIYLSCLNMYIDNDYFEQAWYYSLLLEKQGVLAAAYLYHNKIASFRESTDYWAAYFPLEKIIIKNSEEEQFYDLAYLYRRK